MARATNAGDIDIDVSVDGREADLLMRAIESTLMGSTLMDYLQDFMAPYMRRRAAERFAAEGDEASGTWQPLKDATVEIREKAGFPGEHPINKRTGELEAFMTRGNIDYTIQGNAASMFFPGRTSGELAEKVKTAQRGKEKPATVARPVAAVSAVDMAYFMNNFSFWFAKEVQARFHGGGGTGGSPEAGATGPVGES